MKNYTLVKEHPDHFLLHNGVAHFKVAKAGLSEPTADKIRAFSGGGELTRNSTHSFYADGGPIEKTPYETGIEAQAQKEAEQKAEKDKKPADADQPFDYVKYNNPDKFSEGGKLTAKSRAEIPQKNFALPGGRYPIEDANHARNALARVSQHGSPEEKAEVRSKVEHKYPGIKQNFSDGGQAATPEVTEAVHQAASDPQHAGQSQADTDAEAARQARYAKIRETNTANMSNGNYAGGGPVASNSVNDISNETQSQAIGRYAAGNPATLAKGGAASHHHTNAGKNQLHFHFYDGATIPTQLDKEEGAGPQQATPLDKESAHFAEGTDKGDVASTAADQMTDSDKLAAASNQIQQDTSNQDATIAAASQDAASGPAQNAVSPAVTNQIPASQQISAAPKASAPTPDQNPTMLSDLDKSISQQTQGIQDVAKAQTQGFRDTAKAIGDQVMQQKARNDAYKLAGDNLTKQNEQLFNAVASSKIDPNQFWNSMSTGGKIAASIGILLGGIAGGVNRTHENVVLNQLNNHVQQDIEAQKMDQSNKMSLYKMGLEKYKDQQSAEQFATLQSNALLQGQLQKIAAQTGSQTAMATANQMIGQIGVQNANLRAELAMKQAAMNVMNGPQKVAGVDPNSVRLLINAGVIPKEEVPAAMKEYGDYEKLSTTLDHTDDVFKKAQQNANYTERLANSLPLGSHIPTIRDSSKEYEALTNAWLGNITKDTEGRVTPTDVDLMRGSLPKAGDSPALVQTKLANIKDMIRQKYDFPTLKSYKLLHPNDPVAQSAATRSKKFTESAPR